MKYRINLMNLLLYFITTLPTLTLLIVTGNILKINYLTILIILMAILVMFDNQQKEEVSGVKEVRWIKVYSAYLIDIVIYFSILILINKFYERYFYYAPITYTAYFSSFLLFNNQVFFRSIGFRIFGIFITNNSSIEKGKIIIINYIIFGIDILLTINNKFPNYESIIKPISEFLIMLCFFNISSRIWIFKTQSALEKLLNVHIYQKGKLNNETEKKD